MAAPVESLLHAAIYRSWRAPQPDGKLSPEDVGKVREKARDMRGHLDELDKLNSSPVLGIVVSPRDFPREGREIFEDYGLEPITADTVCDPKQHSYATMLNTGLDAAGEGRYVAIVNPSTLKNPETAARQVMALAETYHIWQPEKISIVESAIDGEQDFNLLDQVLAGSQELDLDTAWRLTVNNTMVYRASDGIRYSPLTDNNRLGPGLGGSDAFKAFVDEAKAGRDTVLVTFPILGPRTGKIDLVGNKIQRRIDMHRAISQNTLNPDGRLSNEEVDAEARRLLLQHFYIVQVTDRPQVDFTPQQIAAANKKS